MTDERRDDEPVGDERIRRLSQDALAGDEFARADLFRELLLAGIEGWAFVWDAPVTHVKPAPGAVRIDAWAAKDDSQPRRPLAHGNRGLWAVAAVDLDDLFGLLWASPAVSRGWILNVSTGQAITTAALQRLEAPVLRDYVGGVGGTIIDFLEEAGRIRTEADVGLVRDLVAQAISADPASDLAWAWMRSIPRAWAGSSTSAFFMAAVRSGRSLALHIEPGRPGVATGVVHEHQGRVDPGVYETYVSQPDPPGPACAACGWERNGKVIAERPAIHEVLRSWVAIPRSTTLRLRLDQAVEFAGMAFQGVTRG